MRQTFRSTTNKMPYYFANIVTVLDLSAWPSTLSLRTLLRQPSYTADCSHLMTRSASCSPLRSGEIQSAITFSAGPSKVDVRNVPQKGQ